MSSPIVTAIMVFVAWFAFAFGYYIGAIKATLDHNKRIGKKVSLVKVTKAQTKVFVDDAAKTVSTIREMQQMPRLSSDGVHPTKSWHQTQMDTMREIEGLVDDVKTAKKSPSKPKRKDVPIKAAVKPPPGDGGVAFPPQTATAKASPTSDDILQARPVGANSLKHVIQWSLSIRDKSDTLAGPRHRQIAVAVLVTSLNVLHIAERWANYADRGLVALDSEMEQLEYAHNNVGMPSEIRKIAYILRAYRKEENLSIVASPAVLIGELIPQVKDRAWQHIDHRWPDEVKITWLFTTIAMYVAKREDETTDFTRRRSHADVGNPFPWDRVQIDMYPWTDNYRKRLGMEDDKEPATEKEVAKGIAPMKPVARKRTATTDSEEDTK